MREAAGAARGAPRVWLVSFPKAWHPRARHPHARPPLRLTPAVPATNVAHAAAPPPRPGDVTLQLRVDLGPVTSEQCGCVELNVLSFSPQINSF